MATLTNTDIHSLKEKLSFYLKRWRTYPLGFIMEGCQALKYGPPTAQQARILNYFPATRYLAVRSGHGVGKSRMLAWLDWWHMVCNKVPGVPLKIPCTGPTAGGLSDVLWSELEVVHSHMLPWIVERFTINEDGIHCLEASRSWFMSPRTARKENPNAMQGFHGTPLYTIDEAPEVPDNVFEVVAGSMTDESSMAIMMGNPTRLNGYFRRAFTNPNSKWTTDSISCYDSLTSDVDEYIYIDPFGERITMKVPGRIKPSYIDEMKDEYGENSAIFAYRVKGEFPDSETDQLIPKAWVDRADHDYVPDEGEDKDSIIIMGVDVAWTGNNDSSYVVRRGRNIFDAAYWHGNDPTETADKIAARFQELKEAGLEPRWICVDVIGVGSGVYSNLYHMKLPVIPVKAYDKAPDDGGTVCYRMRDWLWWKTRNFFRDHKPCFSENSPAMERLKDELSLPGYKTKNGKIYVETKDEMSKRGIKSPDLADALVETFIIYSNIAKKKEKKKSRGNRSHKRDRYSKQPQSWKFI